MAQGVIYQHQRQHGLRNRRRADAHAGIVTSMSCHLHGIALAIDCGTGLTDTGSGFQRQADRDVLPAADTAKYAAGADVFVSEGQLDTPSLQALKFGMPEEIVEYTIDSWHTMYYAAGHLFKQVNPRIAAINHYEAGGGATDAESIAEIRAHWQGLFMWGGPDVQILNVTKHAIWAREAALPEGAAIASIDPRMLVPPGAPIPDKVKTGRISSSTGSSPILN